MAAEWSGFAPPPSNKGTHDRPTRGTEESRPSKCAQPKMAILYRDRLLPAVPHLKTLGQTLSLRDRDQADQRKKYNGAEPAGGKARFAVTLPMAGQSRKYCWQKRPPSEKDQLDSAAEVVPQASSALEMSHRSQRVLP